MDNQAKDEDIFYSDEEFSDSEELYQQASREGGVEPCVSFASSGWCRAGEHCQHEHLRVPGVGAAGSALTYVSREKEHRPQGTDHSQVPEYFPGKAERPGEWIDRPITQISSGLAGLGGGLLGQARRQGSAPAPRTLTYSSIASKQPLQPQKPNINKPKQPQPTPTIFKSDSKSKITCSRVSETALMAGYRFRASDPQHDPRYPQDQQMMVGPIPGHLDHDVIYNGLRSIFQAWGPVCFMFLHKTPAPAPWLPEASLASRRLRLASFLPPSAVKDNDSGKPVKFGYVVFAEKGVAQKVLKGGSIPFNGGIKIKVTAMS